MIWSKRNLIIIIIIQFTVIVVLVTILTKVFTWTPSDNPYDNRSEYELKALDSRVLETSQNKSVLVFSSSYRKRIFLQ